MTALLDSSLHVAFCVDDNFCQHLAPLVLTLQRHCQQPIHAHLLSNGLLEANVQALSSMQTPLFQWSFYTIDNKAFSALPISLRYGERVTCATYFRMALPELLPNTIQKVLYLDADMIALGDISPLWDIELHDSAALVVADGSLSQQQRWTLLGCVEPHYFNAGMMLINLATWRAESLAEKTFSFLNQKQNLEYNDQDLLNLALNECVQFAELKWNTQSFHLQQNAVAQPILVHFTGVEKPWHISSNQLYQQVYLEARLASPYKAFSLELYLDEADKKLLAQIQYRQLTHAKVVIYGAGQRGRRLFHALERDMPEIEVLAFVDKHEVGHYQQVAVNQCLPELDFDFVILSSVAFQEEIIAQLKAWLVPQHKMIYLQQTMQAPNALSV